MYTNMSYCTQCGETDCKRHPVNKSCNHCGKSFTQDRYLKHIEKCSSRSAKRSSNLDIKSYYEAALQQLHDDSQKEISQLRNTIAALNHNADRQKERFREEFESYASNLEKRNQELTEKLRSVSIAQTLSSNMESQYTRDLANRNVEISRLQQEIQQLKSDHSITLQNNQVLMDKKIADIEQDSRLQIEKIKMEYTPKIAYLERSISDQKELYNQKFKDDMQLIQSKYNQLSLDLRSEFEQKEKEYTVKIKQITKEKDEQIASVTSQNRNMRHEYDYVRSKLQEVTDKLASVESTSSEKIRSMNVTIEQEKHANTQIVNTLKSKIKSLNEINEKQAEEIKQIKLEKNNLEDRTTIDFNTLRHKVRQHQASVDKMQTDFIKKEEELYLKYQDQLTSQSQKISELSSKCDELAGIQDKYNSSIKRIDGLNAYNKDLVTQINKLKDIVQELKHEKQKIMSDSQLTTNAIQVHKSKLAELTKQNSLYEVDKRRLILTVDSQKEQILQLETNYKDIQDKYHNILHSTKMTLQDEKELVIHLKSELAKLTLENQEIGEYKNTVNVQESQINKMKINIQKLSSDLEQLTSRHSKVTDELVNVTAGLHEQIDNVKKRDDRIRNYESKFTQLHNELNISQSKISKLEKEYQDKCKEFAQSKKEYDNANSELQVCRNKIHTQHIQISNLHNEKDSIINQYNELRSVNEAVASGLKELKNRYDILSGKNIAINDKSISTRKEYESLRSEFNKYKKDNDELVNTLNEKLKARSSELSDSQKQLKNYEQALKDTTQLEKSVQEYKKKCMERETDLSILQTNSEKIIQKFKHELAITTAEHTELREKIRTLTEQNSNYQQKLQQMSSLENKIDSYNTTISQLTDLKYKFPEIESSRNKYKAMYQNVSKECERLTRIDQEYTNLQSQYKDIKTINHTLQTTISKNSQQIEALQSVINKQATVITSNDKMIDKLQNELKKKIELEKYLTEQINTVENTYKNEKVMFLNHMTRVDEQYKKLETDLAYSNGKLSNIEDNSEKLAKLTDDFNTLSNQFKKIKQINSELRDMKAELEQKLSLEQQKYADVQNKITALRNENVDLSRILEKAQKSIERNSVTHKATVNNLNIQLDDLHTKYKIASEKIVDIRQKNSIIEELEQHNKKLTIDIDNTKRINNELAEKFTKLEKEYTSLSKKHNISKLYEVQVDTLIEENKTIRNARDELAKELKLINSKEILTENNDLKQKVVKLNENINTLTTECDTYRRQCRDLEHNTNILSEYKDKIITLDITVKNLSANNQELSKRLKELPTMFEVQKNEELRLALASENATLLKRLNSLSSQIRTLDKLKENDKRQTVLLNEKENKLIQLNNEIGVYLQQIEDYNVTQQLLRDEMAKIRDTIEPLKREIEAKNKEIAELKLAPERLNAKVKRLRDDSLTTIHKYINSEKKVKIELQALKERNTELQHAIEMLTNEIDQSNSDIKHLIDMKDELKTNFIRNLNEQKTSGELQIFELQKLIDLRDSRIKELEELLNTFVKKQLGVAN